MKFQIAVLADGMAALDLPDELSAVEWLTCGSDGAHAIEFRKNGVTLSVVDFRRARFDLPSLIAIIVPAAQSQSKALQVRWTECFPAVELDFISVASFESAVLLRAALDAMGNRLLSQRSLTGRAALDLAVYRREFERLQHSFSRLEEFVSQHASEGPVVLFEYPALARVSGNSGSATGTAADDSGTLRVLQALPVDSLGLAGVALQIRGPLPPGESLRASLYAVENDRTYGTWTIEAAQVPPGWLHLALTRAIDEPALSLEVGIDLPSRSGHAALALGQPHPYEEFCARIDGGESLRAPLALRIFGGLPGVRVPGVSGAFSPTGTPGPPVTFVAQELLTGAYQVFPPPDRDRNKFVIYDAASGSVTVHPHEGGTRTIGRLDLLMPPNAWRLSVQVSLEHELANPTRFALSAIPVVNKGTDGDAIEAPEEGSMWFSGWVELAALEKKKISVLIPPGEARVLTVYLLTQQAPDASADYAWARFAGFAFNSAPHPMQRNPGSCRTQPSVERADAASL